MHNKEFDPGQIQNMSGEHAPIDEELEELAYAVIGAAIEVHKELGPGFPESVYERALSLELVDRSIPHITHAPVKVWYKDREVGEGRIDILVKGQLILELKSIESLTAIHQAQTIAYLKATQQRLGLLINFNTRILKDGIKRIVL